MRARQARERKSRMSKEELVSAYRKVFIDIWYDQSMYSADKQELADKIAKRLSKLDKERLEEDERNAVV